MASELVHIPWFTLPGRVWGLSPLGAFATTVATGLSAQEYTREWFESGGVPPATFKNVEIDYETDTVKPPLVFFDVHHLTLDHFKLEKPSGIESIRLEKVSDFEVHDCPGFKDEKTGTIEKATR